MKYQPIYLPATDNKELLKEHPIFDTEEGAWEYIHDNYCHCGMEIRYREEEYCSMCEAEWTVDDISI